MTSRSRSWLALAALATLLGPRAAAGGFVDRARKTTDADLDVPVQRVQLPNGLVLLMAPDATASGVAVWMTFRAGAIYEPPGRSGLAHLVEHLVATGRGPDSDYAGLLERRGARYFNATTDFDAMSFQAVLPADELPVGLWVAAERLRALPRLLEDAVLEPNRRVVVQERALRDVDAPYGLVREGLWQCLYRAPHPLHGGVIGLPQELAAVTAADARAFATTYLVPANAVLVLVGRFDPAIARRLVEAELGALPAGKRAAPPPLPARTTFTGHMAEPLGREPRVAVAWRFPGMLHDEADALRLGAQFLTFMTDGAWGMRIAAHVSEYAGEAAMTMELSVPYDEPQRAVQDDAFGFLRMLTHKQMPPDMMDMANLALDREALFMLDDVEGRAALLTRVELLMGAQPAAAYLGSHWALEGQAIQGVAWSRLRGPSVVLHARPQRPRPARPERE